MDYFNYRNNELFTEEVAVADIVYKYGSPCYIYSKATLEMLSRLPIDIVIPGHGSPFAAVDVAFERAFRRLGNFRNNIGQLAWHAIKVIVAFAMMERRQLPKADFPAFVLSLPFAVDVNTRFLNLSDERLVAGVERELLLVNALRLSDGMITAG